MEILDTKTTWLKCKFPLIVLPAGCCYVRKFTSKYDIAITGTWDYPTVNRTSPMSISRNRHIEVGGCQYC